MPAINDPLVVHPLGINGLGYLWRGGRMTAPTSAVYVVANRAHYVPFYLNNPYSLARWLWLNGATISGTTSIMVGIYDDGLRLRFASPRTFQAGSVNTVQYVKPGIFINDAEGTSEGGDTTDLATYTTGSITMRAGLLYILSVVNTHGTSASAVSAITGGGTWTSRSTVQWNGTLGRTSIWTCVPTADYTGTLSIAFGGVTQTNANWNLDACYGVDTATNDGVVQSTTATGSSTTPSATLGAFADVDNGVYAAVGSGGTPTNVPDAGYFELLDATTAVSHKAFYRPDNDTTPSSVLSGNNPWGECAIELKAVDRDSPVVVPPMRGWLAIWASATAATIFRCGILYVPFGEYIQDSLTVGLPLTMTPVGRAGGMQEIHTFGFTRRSSP